MAWVSAYQVNLIIVLPSPSDSSKAVAADPGLPDPSVLNEKEKLVLNLLAHVDWD